MWALSAPGRLPRKVRADLESPENSVFASAASTWEIAIKRALGKIEIDVTEIASACATTGFEELPVRMTHTARVTDLPAHHRDPFDRLLIAQALEEGLELVSRDPLLRAYAVPIRWG